MRHNTFDFKQRIGYSIKTRWSQDGLKFTLIRVPQFEVSFAKGLFLLNTALPWHKGAFRGVVLDVRLGSLFCVVK